MGEKRTCPIYWKTSLYNYGCNAQIIKKEPAISVSKVLGHICGPVDLRGCRTGEKDTPYYHYYCEEGHILTRPKWWADVPIVPPGTASAHGIVNKPHKWFAELSEVEKEKVWK